MPPANLNRRDFSKLTAAAFGGLVAGAAIGCSRQAANEPASNDGPLPATGENSVPAQEAAGPAASNSENFLLGEVHVCRGLNVCKSHGQGGENACAGLGTCATVEAHSCAGENACKGQGGCGAETAVNACKGQGGCGVPLHAGAWEKARAVFEERMKAESKTFGEAPPRA